MELKSLNCNNCGAQLDVPDVVKFVTCGHCGSRLAIHRTNSASYTENIDQLARTTSQLVEQVSLLAYRHALDRIDQNWEQERAKIVPRNANGECQFDRNIEQSKWIIAVGAIACVVSGMLNVVFPWQPAWLALFLTALFMTAVMGLPLAVNVHVRDQFRDAHAAYLAQRASIPNPATLPCSSGAAENSAIPNYALHCDSCGAELDAPELAKFITCSFCDSNLAIRRTESGRATNSIDEAVETIRELAQDPAGAEYRDTLDRIDAAWELERERYFMKDQHGNDMSSSYRRQAFICIAICGSVITFVGAFTENYFEVVAGLAMVGFSLVAFNRVKKQELEYQRAYERYLTRRARVQRKGVRERSAQEQV